MSILWDFVDDLPLQDNPLVKNLGCSATKTHIITAYA